MKTLIIDAPAIWTLKFAGETEQIDESADSLINVLADMFGAYYITDRFNSLDYAQKQHITCVQKNLIRQIQEIRFCSLSGPLRQIEVLEEISDVCDNVVDYQSCIELTDSILFSLLAENNGNDLRPDGYINTDVRETKEMICQLFTSVLNQTFEDVLYKKHPVITEEEIQA